MTTSTRDRSRMAPEVQTDKAKTKEVPCTRCRRPLIVNTFYAPAKALCSDCRSEGTSSITPAMRAAIAPPAPDEPVEPNRSLADLRCMFDDHPMILIRIEDGTGFMTFECPECLSAVEVMPKFSPLLIAGIPEALKPVVDEMNRDQVAWGAVLAGAGEIKQRFGITDPDRASRRIKYRAA